MGSHDGDEPATSEQHKQMHVLWRKAGVRERDQRLALTSAAVGEAVTTSATLTRDQAARLIKYMRRLDRDGQLAARVGEFLARQPS